MAGEKETWYLFAGRDHAPRASLVIRTLDNREAGIQKQNQVWKIQKATHIGLIFDEALQLIGGLTQVRQIHKHNPGISIAIR